MLSPPVKVITQVQRSLNKLSKRDSLLGQPPFSSFCSKKLHLQEKVSKKRTILSYFITCNSNCTICTSIKGGKLLVEEAQEACSFWNLYKKSEMLSYTFESFLVVDNGLSQGEPGKLCCLRNSLAVFQNS